PQASRELAELRTSSDYQPPFEVVRRRVIDDYYEGKMTIDATVVIRVGVTETYTHASGEGTEADVVSVKKFSDGHSTWSTLAKSANTVEAGWQSLLDGYEWRINNENLKLARVGSNPRLSRR